MLNYDKDTKALTIVAKDTGSFTLSLDNYLLGEGDKVYFTVNTELENPEPVIQKEITVFDNYCAVIALTTEDTNIAVGTYYYDIEVNTVDGRVDTVLGPAKFKVVGGVKY